MQPERTWEVKFWKKAFDSIENRRKSTIAEKEVIEKNLVLREESLVCAGEEERVKFAKVEPALIAAMHNTDSGPESGTVAAAVAAAAAAAAAASAPGGTTGGGGGGSGMGRPTVGAVSGATAAGGGGAGSVGAGGGQGGPRECAGCGKAIRERYLLKALEMFWHEDCLKCGCCDCRLGEVGSTLYTKANLILCRRDYLRLFGTTGYCAACNKVIPAFEMVMRAKSNVYHLECFACQQCNHRFCVGDRFYLCDNKILCEYDYEERLVFANMACNPSSLAHIRSQETI